MQHRHWVVMVGLLAAAVGVSAQGLKDGEKMLRDSLIKKRMIPRGFSADSEVGWRWDGSALVMEPPKVRTLGMLDIKSVKVKDDSIQIKGERRTLLRKSDTQLIVTANSTPVTIYVNLQGADAPKILPKLVEDLFYRDEAEALADLPVGYADEIPALALNGCCRKPKEDLKACDCADLGATSCRGRPPEFGMRGMLAPRVVYQQESEFSEEARQEKISGNVMVGLTVGMDGHPSGLWLGRTVGSGLDEQALKAVRQYVFAPATCHGKAVPVVLSIEVDFQIF